MRAEIRELRRRIRVGGQLQAGDFLLKARFRLIEPLGRGGFAQVWKAFDKQRRELVAIKVLHGQYRGDETRRDRFFRGARLMADLFYTGIVRVHEAKVEDDGYYFFVMEYVEGGDFHQAVVSGALSVEQRLGVIQAVGDALGYAHERGLVHRDIKPANILLDAQGQPKLTDFDLVRAEEVTSGLTHTGMMGTFLYAAPELMTRPQEADAAADVYGLAMTTVFALYGGALPYTVMRDASGLIDRLDVRDAVKIGLKKGVEWDLSRRWDTVAALCEALMAPEAAEGEAPVADAPIASETIVHAVSAPSPAGVANFRDPFLSREGEGPAMVSLPGGAFYRRKGDDRRQEVILAAFSVGRYLVTFEEYDAFCEITGRAKPLDEGWGRGRRPVINVSWDDAAAYAEWLSQQTGCAYHLLSEAQWEYACRAGSGGTYCFGDGAGQLGDYAWYRDNSGGRTHPVGEKQSNAWGLYDMHGNVWEWVADWYGDYPNEVEIDPSGPESGLSRVLRGGCWGNVAGLCRSSFRYHFDPRYRYPLVGFRLARTDPEPSDPFILDRETAAASAQRPQAGLRDRLQDGSEGPAMAWLPGGVFCMGEDRSRYANEKPVHEVEVGAFSISQSPVTFEAYDQFCEATGRELLNDLGWGRGQRPVTRVSWDDAAAYCEWLSEQTGERYRLPTEAEWEYACRAGRDAYYHYGDDEARLGDYAWYSRNAEGRTHPVREKLPNDWQLYDIHGNVWEWVQDWYADDYYQQSPRANPGGPESGSTRVLRGGSWDSGAGLCRSSFRLPRDPGLRDHCMGFRLARDGAWPSGPFTLGGVDENQRRDGLEFSQAATNQAFRPFQVFQDPMADGERAPELVSIPGGVFTIGNVEGNRRSNEQPAHAVMLGAFAMGRYPVTVAEYMRFVDSVGRHYPEWCQPGGERHLETGSDAFYRRIGVSLADGAHPVVGVSWNDAAAYCEWLSEQTGKPYQLPTEAQWEYACRAGSSASYCFGGNASKLDDYAWHSWNAGANLHPVGRKRPNVWGLYDMHGLVWEWVADWYGPYSADAQLNPRGPKSGSLRVLRGGSWDLGAGYCRSSIRYHFDPGHRGHVVGFRLARQV